MKIKRGQKKLTKAQEKLAKDFASRTIKRHLSTKQHVSDKTIKTYVANVYKMGNKTAPRKIRWFDSPEALCKVRASVGDSVVDSVGDSVRDSVWASVRASVGDSVRDSVWASVVASVGDSVVDSVGDSVRDSVRDSVVASVWASVVDSVRAWDYSGYLSYYRFFHDNFEPNKLVWLHCLSENVTGYAFYEKECWLVRKPILLERDSEGKLHNEKDMAIKWKDGIGYYFLHGVRVNKNVALGEITKAMFLKEENAEVRRVMIERLGVDSILKLGAKKIDEFKKSNRPDHNYGLYSLPLASRDPDKEAKYLSMRDTSTPRVYYIPVAPELTKAKEALLWYLNLEDYQFDKES